MFRSGPTWCFLLNLKEGNLLVDAGDGKGWDRFQQALKFHGVEPSQITHLLLTHHHLDHTGHINALRKVSPGLTLIAHRSARSWLEKGKMAPVRFWNCWTGLLGRFVKEMKGGAVELKERDIFLDGDDDRLLPSLGLDARIMHTPGHTADSLCILLSDGICLVGDTLMNWPMNLFGANPCPIVYEDRDRLVKSWATLVQSGAKILYPSHGKPVRIERLKKLLFRLESKENP